MISSKFQDLVEGMNKTRLELMAKKRNDYADAGDVLRNFKRVSMAARVLELQVTCPEGYALFMVLMKFDRILNLISNRVTPENESVLDSVIDLHNYLDLAFACFMEREGV